MPGTSVLFHSLLLATLGRDMVALLFVISDSERCTLTLVDGGEITVLAKGVPVLHE